MPPRWQGGDIVPGHVEPRPLDDRCREVAPDDPQPWMVEPAVSAVLAALASGGAQARFVGGSVRDAFLGRPIGDIDIASSVPPIG